MEFKFNLNDKVIITKTRQNGVIFAKAIYVTSMWPQYCVKHVNGHGDLVSVWYDEPDLEIV